MKTKPSIILRFLLLFLLFSVVAAHVTSAEASAEPQKPKIVFGDDINYPPFSYLNKRGQPSGFNVELAKAIGTAMGYEVEVRLGEWSTIRDALKTGEVDVISGMVYSQDREQHVDFSSRHVITEGDIFAKSNVKLNDIKDLENKTVVVQRGDFVGEYLRSLDLNIQIVEVTSIKTALFALEDGKYDYAGLAKLPGLYTLKEHQIKGISGQGFNLATSDYSMAVSKGDEKLLLTINSGMQIIKATGEYERIYEQYLGVYEEVTFTTFLYKYRLVVVSIIILVFTLSGISLLLNHLVKTRTKELWKSNKSLSEKEKQEKIRYLSNHDQLTGLYNRHYFEEKLSLLDIEDNLPFTIVMADVNGLKLTNDAFGHKAGDAL